MKELCHKAREILVEESNVQRVDAPVTVRGAIGGWAEGMRVVKRKAQPTFEIFERLVGLKVFLRRMGLLCSKRAEMRNLPLIYTLKIRVTLCWALRIAKIKKKIK